MFENLTVREWMSSPVIVASPDQSIPSAHELMKSNVIRRLPVVQGDLLAGIVTINDVREASPSTATTLSIWEVNYLWSKLTVKDIMTEDVITARPDQSVVDAAELMMTHRISGLPVVDMNGKLVGVITESDIFRMMVKLRRQEQQTGQAD